MNTGKDGLYMTGKPGRCERIVALAIGILGAILRAGSAVILWRWFVVPTFGLPELTKALAFGLSVTALQLFPWAAPDHKKNVTRADVLGSMLTPYLQAGVGLGIGYLVKLAGGL
jgi:hypothetical protein